MSHHIYRALLKATASYLPSEDISALQEAQSLYIGSRQIDFSFELNPLDETESRIVLRCYVAHLAEAASEEVCCLLLRANNLWAGTRGATLGLRGDRVVILSESARLASLDPAQLVGLARCLEIQASAWADGLCDAQISAPGLSNDALRLPDVA